MTRDRLKTLMTYTHLNDNSAMPAQRHPDYKLYKVKPLMDALLNQFEQCFYPSQQVSIDEAMIKYKGRLSFVQYMPDTYKARDESI